MTTTTTRDDEFDDQTCELIEFPRHTGKVWPLPGDDEDQDPNIPDHPDPEDDDPATDREADDRDDREDSGSGELVLRRDAELVPADDPGTELDRDDDDRDGESGTLVFVDPDPATLGGTVLPWQRDLSRPPIIPLWMRDKHTRVEAVRWAVRAAGHVTGFHTARVPVYAGRLLWRSPRGGYRLARRWLLWVRDAESYPLRLAAIQKVDPDGYSRLSEKAVNRQRARTALSVSIAIAAAVGAGTALVVLPLPVLLLLAAVVIGLLGKAGTNEDRPVFGRAVSAGKVPVLTSDVLVTALGALGIAELNKALRPGGPGIQFPQPITRDGPGWRAAIDLPYGVTPGDILDRRRNLASGLRRPVGCVWPEGDPDEHEGRLIVWVGDRDMATTKQSAWPLAKAGTADIFAELPFGTDQRGRAVGFLLMFANLLIGAMPRQGKTFALRLILLACALDPSVVLYVYELKGTGDLSPIEKVAHRYASGPGDPVTLGLVMDGLRELHKELDTRARTIQKLPKDLCPENKVTPELARNRKLGLAPIVFAIDECQELFTSEHAAEAEELCEAIIKRGPALGIMLILATQRPDSKSLPTGVSANVGIRYCLRVKGQPANDMVLGTSAYKSGIRATEFTNRDKGIGILDGHADTHQIVRSYYIDGPEADRISERARAAREAAGLLTGHAAGETADTAPSYSLLDDLAAIWPAGEDKAWSETLCELLTGLRPEHYRGIDQAALNAQLKPYGLTPDQVWGTDPKTGKGANRRGIRRADLDQARRNRPGHGQDGAAG